MRRILYPLLPGHIARQRGIVLPLALVFLLLLTLLASGALEQALLQQRMAGAQRHAQQAAFAAEAALRGAQWRLWKGAAEGALHCGVAPIADCRSDDPAHPDPTAEAFRHATGWMTDGATEYRGSDGSRDFTRLYGSGLDAEARKTAVLASNPVYLIEELGPAKAGTAGGIARRIYRITARATGGRPHVVRVIEDMFAAGDDGNAE